MSWLLKLYETYPSAIQQEGKKPWPVSHFVKNAHIEVVLDEKGNFRRAELLNGEEAPTLIPATEGSAGRTGKKISPHPLCEELSYCASDLPNVDIEKNAKYLSQLEKWKEFDNSNLKLKAIHSYLDKRTLWGDISSEVEFPIKFKSKSGQATKVQKEKAFVRWRVEAKGIPSSGTWEDEDIIQSWIKYDKKANSVSGNCFVLGEMGRVSQNQPKFIRNPGDGAKLISSNDHTGYTYRGRFIEGKQAVEVGFEVTQKAHNTLRWLISRQGFRIRDKIKGDKVVVSWAVSGKEIPQPAQDTLSMLGKELPENTLPETIQEWDEIDHTIDVGESFAHSLNKFMAGYRAKLIHHESIVIMALDTASLGRMGITYYRETFASEFIDVVTRWHDDLAWFQRYKREIPTGKKKPKIKIVWPLSAPSPKIICEAVYGKTLTDSLKKNLIERILPCIVEGRPIPFDIANHAIRRASNRHIKRLSKNDSTRKSELEAWEKDLGVACALYRGYLIRNRNGRKISMSLELDNNSRDYLFGRLLALAESVENYALMKSDEDRPTNAERLMQRFADRPASTWKNIRLSLNPYMQRLMSGNSQEKGFIHKRKALLDEVTDKFDSENFIKDQSLTGEFLLGFHSQRLDLFRKGTASQENDVEQTQE